MAGSLNSSPNRHVPPWPMASVSDPPERPGSTTHTGARHGGGARGPDHRTGRTPTPSPCQLPRQDQGHSAVLWITPLVYPLSLRRRWPAAPVRAALPGLAQTRRQGPTLDDHRQHASTCRARRSLHLRCHASAGSAGCASGNCHSGGGLLRLLSGLARKEPPGAHSPRSLCRHCCIPGDASKQRDCRYETPPHSPSSSSAICLCRLPLPV